MAVNNSDIIFGEGREGGFDNESEHTRVENVDDGATAVLYLFLDQSLVWRGVRLDLA